jgi:hypothetical protein
MWCYPFITRVSCLLSWHLPISYIFGASSWCSVLMQCLTANLLPSGLSVTPMILSCWCPSPNINCSDLHSASILLNLLEQTTEQCDLVVCPHLHTALHYTTLTCECRLMERRLLMRPGSWWARHASAGVLSVGDWQHGWMSSWCRLVEAR